MLGVKQHYFANPQHLKFNKHFIYSNTNNVYTVHDLFLTPNQLHDLSSVCF